MMTTRRSARKLSDLVMPELGVCAGSQNPLPLKENKDDQGVNHGI